MHSGLVKNAKHAIPLHAVRARDAKAWCQRFPFLKSTGFTAKDGELRLLPGRSGIAGAVLGLGKSEDALALAAFLNNCRTAFIAWARCRIFAAARKARWPGPWGLCLRPLPQAQEAQSETGAAARGGWRGSLAPGLGCLPRPRSYQHAGQRYGAELADAAQRLARARGAKFRSVSGAALARDYPLIAAVGQGSARAPRLIELVGQTRRAQSHLGGQGRLLRYRRL